MYILGISAFYHDSAACLVKDGEIIASAQEERFTRKKHDHAFPLNAIQYCLKEAGIDGTQLDYVAFYDKPFLKFERILETYLAFAPIGIKSFLKAMPLWIKKKLWIRESIKDELNYNGKIIFPVYSNSSLITSLIHIFFLIHNGIAFKKDLIPIGANAKYVSNIRSNFRNGLS